MLSIVLNLIFNFFNNLEVFQKRIYTLFLIFAFSLAVNGQTNIKTMFYNLLNYSTSTVSENKTVYLKTILDEVQPDLFMVSELVSLPASDYLFTNAILASNSDFEKATFQYSQSPATGLQQMVYYNKKKLLLESSEIITTVTRDINHYTFKINTVNIATNPINIEVYVTHLKASTGTTNRQKRLSAIESFVNALNNIPSDSYVIFSGDFNLYTSNEEAYIALLDENNPIVIVDPVNRPCPSFPNDGIDYFDSNNYNSTYFWNNSSFKDVHTQSTRTYASESNVIDQSGATGGLDDRFDFIMMSKNFTTSNSLYYVNNSYKSIGNNENCYNSYIANPNCSGAFSQSLRNALHQFSDHLPVIMEIKTPENTLSTQTITLPFTFSNGNIVTNNLNIRLNLPKTTTTLIIYNQLGQVVKKFFINSNQQDKALNVSNLSKGFYYLTTQNYTKPLKFIKL